jgi:hypothetical protein
MSVEQTVIGLFNYVRKDNTFSRKWRKVIKVAARIEKEKRYETNTRHAEIFIENLHDFRKLIGLHISFIIKSELITISDNCRVTQVESLTPRRSFADSINIIR